MGWDAINIRLSYCRHLPSLQLLPPHIRNPPSIHPPRHFIHHLSSSSPPCGWSPTKRQKAKYNFRAIIISAFLAFQYGVLTWLPSVGLVAGGVGSTNMQMAPAIDHLQRHHLRQQPSHDQAAAMNNLKHSNEKIIILLQFHVYWKILHCVIPPKTGKLPLQPNVFSLYLQT